MGNSWERFAVDDQDEHKAASHILHFFKDFEAWEKTLEENKNVQPASGFADDDARCPHYPVSHLAYQQVLVAFGSLLSLKHMIVNDSGEIPEVSGLPFGPYALVRNAMDSAAQALWLMEPMNSKLRVKRRITAQLTDIGFSQQFRLEAGFAAGVWAAEYRARMLEVATEAKLDTRGFDKWKQKPMTEMLRALDRHNDVKGLTWLASWQLCSGHAHGKQWATLSTHDLVEIPGTSSDVGAEFTVLIKYGSLALVLHSAWALLQVTCRRYTQLARS